MPAIVNEENMDKWLDPTASSDSALQCLTDPSNIRRLVSNISKKKKLLCYSFLEKYFDSMQQWYPVTKSVGNVSYNQRECIEDIKSAKLPSSATKSNTSITKFFKPTDKSSPSSSPSSSPTKSQYFSKSLSPPPKNSPSTPPSIPSPPRDFDAEVGEFPYELLDIPDDQLVSQSTQQTTTTNNNNNNITSNNTTQSPQTVPATPTSTPQTVPSPPHKQKETGEIKKDNNETLLSLTPLTSTAGDEPKTIQPLCLSSSPKHFGSKSKRKLDFEPVSDAKKLKN